MHEEGGVGWVGGAYCIGEAGLDKSTYSVKFLPRAEEGLVNLLEFISGVELCRRGW